MFFFLTFLDFKSIYISLLTEPAVRFKHGDILTDLPSGFCICTTKVVEVKLFNMILLY